MEKIFCDASPFLSTFLISRHSGKGQFGGEGRFKGKGGIRRGEARYVILDALRDRPKHGYEIIKTLEERSSGQYAPSPGTVYPTLQYLEDRGLVRTVQEATKRVYHLTEAGQTELDTHAEEINAFWTQFAVADTSPAEIRFLQDELDLLTQTVWGGLRSAQQDEAQRDDALIRRVRQAVENCRNEIRRILTEPDRSLEKTE
ncbi:MAG: PadR family transcriptional regulator [Drouetiella hepatica Uher 2000/2452]|uniref:PadR family transcriptional regulator n=1 Tax=Drouetiella hepatica Uher 2000/2452 TaxID=904376 RepID=A0A951Q7A3_9CYAN|nr:PadR family transcriptional regulator [Drouetiella hepatica Uher 2000/2452]